MILRIVSRISTEQKGGQNKRRSIGRRPSTSPPLNTRAVECQADILLDEDPVIAGEESDPLEIGRLRTVEFENDE